MHSNEAAYAADVPRQFARGGLVYFVVVGVLGVWLRARYVTPLLPVFEFANIIHAHSHVAYFGWTSLALMAVMYALLPRLTGRSLQGIKLIRRQLWLTHGATIGALITFAIGGYTPISIVFSTFNVLIWYLFMRIYWLNVRGLPKPLPVAVRYWHGAVFLLFASSLGTWLISAMTATGADAVGREAGLNIFLKNFTDGWLLLGLLGAAVALLTLPPSARRFESGKQPESVEKPGSDRWAAGPLPWIVILTPFTFLAELVTFDVAGGVLMVGLAARFALAIPYVWFLWNARQVYLQRKGAGGGALGAFVVAAFAFLAAKALIHGILGVLPAVPSRHMFVAYLHLDLLGFVSCGLLAALYFVFGAPATGEEARRGGGSGSHTGQAGALFLSVGLITMVITLAVVAIIGGSSDAAARGAVADLLQAAFVFGAVAFIGVVLGVAGLWRDTGASPAQK